MNFDIGLHVISKKVLSDHGGFDEEMSVVEFFRQVRRRERLPMNVTVYGLDDYLLNSSEPDSTCEHLHDILSERANHLNREMPCVQFVVDDVEYWGEPVLPSDDEIPLHTVFGGNLEQTSASWYSCPVNVTS